MLKQKDTEMWNDRRWFRASYPSHTKQNRISLILFSLVTHTDAHSAHWKLKIWWMCRWRTMKQASGERRFSMLYINQEHRPTWTITQRYVIHLSMMRIFITHNYDLCLLGMLSKDTRCTWGVAHFQLNFHFKGQSHIDAQPTYWQ